MYIYRTFRLSNEHTPPREIDVREHPTQAEAIEYLETHGGGVFEDIVANLRVEIPERKK